MGRQNRPQAAQERFHLQGDDAVNLDLRLVVVDVAAYSQMDAVFGMHNWLKSLDQSDGELL